VIKHTVEVEVNEVGGVSFRRFFTDMGCMATSLQLARPCWLPARPAWGEAK